MHGLFCGMLGASLVVAVASGCLVDSRCHDDFDCEGNQRCTQQGSCVLECERDEECRVNGVDLGKQCIDNRCRFLYGERVAAPNFCLDVVNPASSYYGEPLCLSQLEGMVVLIYFGDLG